MANEFLEQVHKELGLVEGGEGEKVITDAAGKVVGTVKAQIVRDPRTGAVIGRVEDAPVVDEGPTAHADLEEGFQVLARAAEKDIPPLVDEMTRLAKEARTLQDRTSQWNFSDRLKAASKLAELKAQYDALAGQIGEVRKNVVQKGQDIFIKDFLAAVDAHLSLMERHFRPEENPHVNRF